MKKGFTMVELLAVFTLLGILLLFSVPQITSMLKKGSNESYESFKKNIYLATESYIVEEKVAISNGSSANIYLTDIIAKGYLKSTLVNPKTNKKISTMTTARVLAKKNNEGILSFEFFES